MCPLRLILVFLSATLAAFFVLRNLRSQPQPQPQLTEFEKENEDVPETETSDSAKPILNAPSNSKVCLFSLYSALLLIQIFVHKNVVFLLHHGLVYCSQ